MSKRLFIVANRLPITIDAEAGPTPSSGGLVTAISSYLAQASDKIDFSEIFWTGVPGCSPVSWREAEYRLPSSDYSYIPVFTPKHQYEAYYNGFSNSVLWPLFHYFPSYVEYDFENYHHYMHVNQLFFEALVKHIRPNDVVWIHDYHLLPLAGMLRKAYPQMTIGFFLHIPFPSFEIIRLLPHQWQQELIAGMLGADLIGFHTIDYAAHFLHSVRMVLGIDHDMHVVRFNNRLIKIDVFPISIDYQKFNDAYDDEAVHMARRSLQEKMPDTKIIFSVDRLDYTKGLLNRLKAYELFLQQNPQFHEKVVFNLVIVPSRDTIQKYAERKSIINETISGINSKLGNYHWQPVVYQYNTLSFENMLTLYTACHLALITPLRDGMNLVSKEFVASRKDKKGVLIVSEMAGAARELTDALTINPNDIREMADKIKQGLEMSGEEQTRRMTTMQKRLSYYDVKAWADDFLTQLSSIKKKQQKFGVKFLDEMSRIELIDTYRKADKRLFLLDYDGTLVPFSSRPEEARPTQQVLQVISQLAESEENDVYIISGRDGEWLEQWFGDLPVNLIAEHGARTKYKNSLWTSDVAARNNWKEPIQKVMEVYVRRCAHSFIEEKNYSMVWHYRNADPEQAKLRSMEMISELNEYTGSLDLQILMGNKVVEVRNYGVDKGSAAKKVLANKTYDFIMAVGDDYTDEDIFKALADKKNCFTIKVGAEASFAQYNLLTTNMVIATLDMISNLDFVALNR